MGSGPQDQIGDIVSFGPFTLIPKERLLLRGDTRVELGGRALDILIALTSRPNQMVGKRDLIAQVWTDVIVEEGSLRFHVAALRKALGDGKDGARYITTLAGRGYCFVAPISARSSRTERNAAAETTLPGTNLPGRSIRMVGRAGDVQAISAKLSVSRFVSIAGTGGVGKTTVAVAVAHSLLEAFAEGVFFVDLGAVDDPEMVATSLASTLGLSVQSPDPTPSLIAYLRNKRTLVILDNCEHVIEAAASLAERLFRELPRVHILTTTREPLRVEGEQVHRLPPLLVPPEGREITAATALTYSAVQLFVERTAASGAQFVLGDADAATAASICRRLDGVPLAIELAAGRVEGYGLQQTAALLDERLSFMWLGQRTAPPRQKTLQATLDWSHELLSGAERLVVRRLAVFVGHFSLDAARAVVTSPTIGAALVVVAIDSLVAKSIVVAAPGISTMRYRLLETTRAYARGKLVDAGEAEQVSRRHAIYYRDLLQQTNTSPPSENESRSARRAILADMLGNIRAALEWSLTERGDLELGIQLAAVSAGLFIELSLLSEYRRWTERALSALESGMRGSRWEMELQVGLGHCLMYTKDNGEQAQSALERASEIAEALGDRPTQLRVLTQLHMYYRRVGYFGRLIPIAQRIRALAYDIGDPIGITAAQALLGNSHHLVGHQAEARSNLEASLRTHSEARNINATHFGFHFDGRIPLARVLWLQGFPDRAIQGAVELTRQPTPYEDPVTACVALIWGMAVFRWTGWWTRLEECTGQLTAHAEAYSLRPFQAVALGLEGEALVERGAVYQGIELLRESLARLHAARYELYTAELSCAYALSLATAGHLGDALEAITAVIADDASRGESFMTPELLRAKGELLAQAADQFGAEHYFRESMALADQHAAKSWRLRTAASFARTQNGQGSRKEARSVLEWTYAQFDEGYGTVDLKRAKRLLEGLGNELSC